MPVTITNKTDRPVMIRLNSGRIFYVNGNDTSGEIINVEVLCNGRIDRLVQRNIITVIATETAEKNAAAHKKITAKGKKK